MLTLYITLPLNRNRTLQSTTFDLLYPSFAPSLLVELLFLFEPPTTLIDSWVLTIYVIAALPQIAKTVVALPSAAEAVVSIPPAVEVVSTIAEFSTVEFIFSTLSPGAPAFREVKAFIYIHNIQN